MLAKTRHNAILVVTTTVTSNADKPLLIAQVEHVDFFMCCLLIDNEWMVTLLVTA